MNPRGRSDAGTVTVEAAIALCALVVVLGLALGAITAVTDQLQCADAAREAARLVARGEPERARQVAERIAPPGATVGISTSGDQITVDVTAHSRLLPGVRPHGQAYAIAEPSGGRP